VPGVDQGQTSDPELRSALPERLATAFEFQQFLASRNVLNRRFQYLSCPSLVLENEDLLSIAVNNKVGVVCREDQLSIRFFSLDEWY
jgi:hypothetical protein